MSLKKRYLLFICGLFFMSLGICLIIKSSLGTSPISSIPYILSLKYPLSLGMFTFLFNMVLVLGQILILRKQFPSIQYLQIPMTVIFSCFMDFVMLLLTGFQPDLYLEKLLILFLGCLSLAMGVALQIIGNVVMLPGEGFVYSIVKNWNLEIGRTKTFVDISLVIIAAVLSFSYFAEIRAIREGTLISAFLVGSIVRFYLKHLSTVTAEGTLKFNFSLRS